MYSTTIIFYPNLFLPKRVLLENLNWISSHDAIPKFVKIYKREEIHS